VQKALAFLQTGKAALANGGGAPHAHQS